MDSIDWSSCDPNLVTVLLQLTTIFHKV